MDEMRSIDVMQIVEVDEASAPFFDGAARGQLMLQKCANCGEWNAPQSVFCMECNEDALEWKPASGKGTVHSFTIIHRAQIPGIEAPYNVSIIETQEGPRIISQVLDVAPEDLVCNMQVHADFRRLGGGATLPYFSKA